jgi:hypothetical protein
VPGVFGVAQDRGDGGLGPAGSLPGRRVDAGVGVEPGCDGGHGEFLVHPPGEDLGDDRPAVRVGEQPGLGAALESRKSPRQGSGRSGLLTVFHHSIRSFRIIPCDLNRIIYYRKSGAR